MQSKNRCLNRFLDTSEKFLESAEQGDLSELDGFQDRRDVILRAIDLYDRKIEQLIAGISSEQKTPEFLKNVKEIIFQKDKIILEIQRVDAKIIHYVMQERESVAREISASRKSRKIIGKFKSSQNVVSERLDETL